MPDLTGNLLLMLLILALVLPLPGELRDHDEPAGDSDFGRTLW